MSSDPDKTSLRQSDMLGELQGEIHALKGIVAILIAHISLLARAPLGKREEILSTLNAMLPDALARIEHDALPSVAAGFERTVESVTHMARHAVRIESVTPASARASKPSSG